MKNEIERKTIGKEKLVKFVNEILKQQGYRFSERTVILPVISAFLFAINRCLEKDIEVNLRGFGVFQIRDNKKQICKFGDKEFHTNKRRRVHFKYFNKNF